jgi:streptogramin lyase
MTTQTTLSLDEVWSYILDPSAFYDVQVTRYTATVRAPAHRTYTLDADFDEGTPIWIEHETVHDQLQLSKNVTALPFIWVPNNEGTVSKINTNTGKEIGRYWVSDGIDSSPSRTTVDLLGGCWIGCRQRGTVVKIGLFEAGQWIDRNLDGICQTSQDTNADGNITGSEILPWGQDECVLYEVVLVPLFEGVYVPGTYGGPYDYDYWGVSPRGLAIDASNNLWAGTFSTSKYYYVDGATGVIIRSVDVAPHNAYGAVIDENGILWSAEGPKFSGNQPNVLLRFDPSTNATSSVDIGHTCYGLGLDYNHHLWVSSYWRGQLSRIDISADPPTFVTYNTPEQIESRGVAATSDNSIWVANTGADTVTRYDNSGNLLATITGLNGPTGVSVDANGKVWATDLYDEYLHRIDPASNTIDLSKQIIGSGGHYTYSDMTGIVLRSITTKIGTWTVVFDSTTENTPWGTISWNSSEPEGTSITVKVRSSNDTTNWSTWESAANGVRLSSTPDARYLQIETTFQIISGTVSPILYDLTVAARAAAHDIAITEVTPSKTVVGQGYSLNINVTAANQGDYTEIFNVTVYANTTSIATQTISLTSGNSTTITFPWNTTGFAKGNYTTNAVADTVPGETHIADNTFADGWVIVAMVGDITGPEGFPDGDVDIRDVSAVARLFGVSSPSPEYNPNFDINGDGDIDIKDVSTVARHFGEHV